MTFQLHKAAAYLGRSPSWFSRLAGLVARYGDNAFEKAKLAEEEQTSILGRTPVHDVRSYLF